VPEEYTGIKFSVQLSPGERETGNAPELLKWCREFYEMGIASPGGEIAGNISVRTKRGFLITPGGRDFSNLAEEELVEVIEVSEETHTIKAVGKLNPSSEAFLHAGIYAARPEVNAVLHGHNPVVTEHAKELGVVETAGERPYGSLELRDEVLKALGVNNLLQMKGHGFIALGASLEEAGKLAMELNEMARGLVEK